LANKVDATVLVCDSHNDAVGDEEESSKTEGEEETIPRQVNRITKKGQKVKNIENR
jgi:hypothetical protein